MEELRRRGFKVRSVVIFGSYAKGDFTEESDVDLCVVADNLPEEEIERRTLRKYYTTPGVEVVAYSPDEFKRMLEKLNPVVLDIVDYGKALMDDGFFKECREALDRLFKENRLTRVANTWRWKG